MIIFMDSSALIKRYIEESGSNEVNSILEKADDVIVSPVTLIEMNSAFRRRYSENNISKSDYEYLKEMIENESKDFSKIIFDSSLENKAIYLINKYQIRTLDSIQLASAIISESHLLVTSDKKLAHCAKSEEIETKFI